MNIDYISKKLFKNSIKDYIILILSLGFSVCMVTCIGLMLFSPTVLKVIEPGGSTQEVSQTILSLMIFACLTFEIYSLKLFLKKKSREIGIFKTLGASNKTINKVLKKQVLLCAVWAGIIGILAAFLLLFIIYVIFRLFINSPELVYSVGYIGLLIGVLIDIISVIIINILMRRYISKLDIMDVLREKDANEEVKLGGKPFLMICGIVVFLLGFVLFTYGFMYGNIFMIDGTFLGMFVSVVGLYLTIAQISGIGVIIKKVSRKIYNRNIVLMGILKLKGKQYVVTVYICMLLTSVGFFALILNLGPYIEGSNSVYNYKYDFEYVELDDIKIHRDYLQKMASRNSLNITEFNEIEGLLLVPKAYGSWGEAWDPDELFTKESDFNKIFGEKIDVIPGKYVIAVDFENKRYFNEMTHPRYRVKFYNTTTEQDLKITPQETIEIGEKMLRFPLTRSIIRVLDDKDYENIEQQLDKKYKCKVKMFNVDNYKKSYDFSVELFNLYLKSNNYKYEPQISERGKNKILNIKNEILTVNEITLEMQRWWPIMPFSRIYKVTTATNEGAIYISIFLIIALTCLLLACIIAGIKLVNVIRDSKVLFKKLNLIGVSNEYKKGIIKKQILLIFLIPNVISILMAVYVFLTMMSQQAAYMKNIIYCISLIFAASVILQVLLFVIINAFIGKKLMSDTE